MSEETTTIGIDKIKQAIALLATIGESLEDDLKDGKISLAEGIGYATQIPSLLSVAKDYKELGQQWADLQPGELEELIAYAKEQYDSDDQHAEEIVDATIDVLGHLGGAVTSTITLVALIKADPDESATDETEPDESATED